MGFGVLIAAPLVFLAGAVVTRIACELAIVGCRIAESTAETAERVAEISMSTKGQGAAESTR